MGTLPRGRIEKARHLRKAAPSAEHHLWYFLRNRQLDGLKFSRQVPIGRYVADFVCREASLIIELDGGQHAESASDEQRTAFLNAEGYSVLRIWNNELYANRDGVLQTIVSAARGVPSPDWRFAPADLSPTGRGTRGAHAARSAFAAHLPNSEQDP